MMRLLSDSSARGPSSVEQRGTLLSLSWRTVGLILALILLPTVSRAQPHKLDTPTDSPLWWTLTDEITPQKLKALYADRTSSLARYDDAVEAGLEEPLPARGKRSRACLTFYRNAELTPQLEPMWIAFRAFYNAHLDQELSGNEYVDAVPHRLQEFGISPSGVDVILAAAKSTKAEVKRRSPEFIPRIGDAALLIDDDLFRSHPCGICTAYRTVPRRHGGTRLRNGRRCDKSSRVRDPRSRRLLCQLERALRARRGSPTGPRE